MAVDRIKWNMKGFKELRKSRPVMSDLIDRAGDIADASGDGYDVSPFTGKNRARVTVMAVTAESRDDNARNNTLLRNMGRGA